MASSNDEVTESIASECDVSRSTSCRRSRVSVIIPTYNCAGYIGGALRSVAIQSYADWEIIVVDDGSSDETRAAVAECRVPCRYVMNQRKKGPAGARNQGILLSEGQYIAFLDADDAWLPNKLALQMAVLQGDPQLLALGGMMIPWDSSAIDAGAASAMRCYSFAEMVVHNRLGTPTVICRRDALASVGLFDESMHISEDYELWLRLSRIGRVGRLETPMARFRARPDGLSAGNRDRTSALDRAFTRSLQSRYANVPGIRRLVKKGLAARSFERAIELCDVEKRYWEALRATANSIWNWPWTNPSNPSQPLTRLRRIRRIALDALNARHDERMTRRGRMAS